MPKPIIVGIDPGTTSGYAVLDTNGKLLKIASSKEFGLNPMIREVNNFGLPTVVATDKADVPDLVAKFAASTRCKVFSPKADVKVSEKKELADKFSYDDDHQRDALGSALLAYNSYSKLFDKIKKLAGKEIVDDVTILVVKEGISISDAASILTGKDEESRVVKKAISTNRFTESDAVKLYSRIGKIRNELKLLRKYNAELQGRIKNYEKGSKKNGVKESKRNKLDSRKIDALFKFKEDRIKELSRKIEEREEEISTKEEANKRLDKFLSGLSSKVLLKKLNNLSQKEFDAKRNILKIVQSDHLYVHDPNVYDDKVVSFLKDKVEAIVSHVKPKKATKDDVLIEFVSDEDLEIEELDNFASVEEKKLMEKLAKKDVYFRIIEDYKKNRH